MVICPSFASRARRRNGRFLRITMPKLLVVQDPSSVKFYTPTEILDSLRHPTTGFLPYSPVRH